MQPGTFCVHTLGSLESCTEKGQHPKSPRHGTVLEIRTSFPLVTGVMPCNVGKCTSLAPGLPRLGQTVDHRLLGTLSTSQVRSNEQVPPNLGSALNPKPNLPQFREPTSPGLGNSRAKHAALQPLRLCTHRKQESLLTGELCRS